MRIKNYITTLIPGCLGFPVTLAIPDYGFYLTQSRVDCLGNPKIEWGFTGMDEHKKIGAWIYTKKRRLFCCTSWTISELRENPMFDPFKNNEIYGEVIKGVKDES